MVQYSRYESHFLNSKDLKNDLPLFLSWYAEDVTRIVESEVRDVESMIRKAYPEAAYIELEPDSKRTFETAMQAVRHDMNLSCLDIYNKQHNIIYII